MEQQATKRKPDAVRVEGANVTKETVINGCIDFTITNAGANIIYYGFSKDSEPDIPLSPGDSAPWPLYRPCEEWDGELRIKFINQSIALVLKTI